METVFRGTVIKEIINTLVETVKEENPIEHTFGLKIKFKRKAFMNGLTKRVSYSLESEKALLEVDDLKQTIILSILKAGSYFETSELLEILKCDLDMNESIVQRFYACVCKLSRIDIYNLTSVKYKKPEEDSSYYGTEYYMEYSELEDGDKFIEKLLHEKLEKMQSKSNYISTPLSILIYNSDFLLNDIKDNNVEFLLNATDRRAISKSQFDNKIQCLKKSLGKNIKNNGIDIDNMSRREAMFFSIAYEIYRVCNGTENIEAIIKLIERFELLEEYLVGKYAESCSSSLSELYMGTISDNEFICLVTDIICYGNNICSKYNFVIEYKFRSVDLKTEEEIYYFDKIHIKKALQLKDIYPITRVISGERKSYKGLVFEEVIS